MAWPFDPGSGFALIDAAAKSTLVLGLAMLAARGMRGASSAARHRVWASAVLGLLAVPIASAVAPGWHLPGLHPSAPPVLPAAPTVASETIPERPGSPRPASAAPSPSVPTVAPRAAVLPIVIPTAPPRNRTPAPIPSAPARRVSMGEIAAMIWLAGFAAAILPTLVGLVVGEVRRRNARRVVGAEWVALLASVRTGYALRRRVDLRCGGGSPIPMTWGVLRPVVLIPREAEDWPEATRRAVLLHELAHVARLDAGTLLLGRLAASLYWFHPLAWHALNRLRDECEQAADDCVVSAGARPTEYAASLVGLAKTLRAPRLAVAVAMARRNPLEDRIMAMLDTTRSHAPLTRRAGGTLAATAFLAVLAIGTFRAGPAPARARSNDDPKPAAAAKGHGKITGVVLDAEGGKPAAGAEVVLLDPPKPGEDHYYGPLPLHKLKADADGRFTFAGLAPGWYRVWANLEARSSRKHSHRGVAVTVPEAGDGPKPVDLVLSPAPTVTVRVLDDKTGEPIAGAKVEPGWSDLPDGFATDAQGVARVRPLTPERWRIDVRADAYAKAERWVNLENGGDADETFRLAPGGDLEGTIRDPEGKPLAGVGLSAREAGGRFQIDYVKTDAQGRYRLRNLPLSALEIGLSKDDYGRKEVAAQLDGPHGTLDVTLPPRPDGGSIVGVVRDAQGKPIAGATLKNMGGSSNEIREVKTDADGRFRMDDLYEGSTGKDVLVTASGSAPQRVGITPGTREEPSEIVIDLAPGHRVRGRVVDEKGGPLADVMVDFGDGRNPFGEGGRVDTGADGLFSFDALPPNATFGFSKTGFSEIQHRPLTLDGEEVVEVAMSPAGVIAGKVLDAATGRPLAQFLVQITFSPDRRPGDPQATMRSDLITPGQTFQSPEGAFQITDLVLGLPLQVMVSADGYERAVATRVEAGPPGTVPAEEFRLEPIDPKTLVSYDGRLVDAAGKPVVGAQVRLVGSRERPRREAPGLPVQLADDADRPGGAGREGHAVP